MIRVIKFVGLKRWQSLEETGVLKGMRQFPWCLEYIQAENENHLENNRGGCESLGGFLYYVMGFLRLLIFFLERNYKT